MTINGRHNPSDTFSAPIYTPTSNSNYQSIPAATLDVGSNGIRPSDPRTLRTEYTHFSTPPEPEPAPEAASSWRNRASHSSRSTSANPIFYVQDSDLSATVGPSAATQPYNPSYGHHLLVAVLFFNPHALFGTTPTFNNLFLDSGDIDGPNILLFGLAYSDFKGLKRKMR